VSRLGEFENIPSVRYGASIENFGLRCDAVVAVRRVLGDGMMGCTNPQRRVVVLIPVFQDQAEFDLTVESLARATVAADIIVVDDGSQPPLQAPGHGITLVRFAGNRGIVAALNAGLALALRNGYDYIVRMDAGDLAAPDRILRQITYLEEHPECALVGSDAEVRAEGGAWSFTIRPPRDPRLLAIALRERVWLLHSTLTFRASVFREVGLYSDEFEAAEDYEILLRIAKRHKIGVVPDTLVTCTFRQNGISGRKAHVQLVSRFRLQMRYFSWRSPRAYYGLLRTFALLFLPASVRLHLKRHFVYAGAAGGNTSLCPCD